MLSDAVGFRMFAVGNDSLVGGKFSVNCGHIVVPLGVSVVGFDSRQHHGCSAVPRCGSLAGDNTLLSHERNVDPWVGLPAVWNTATHWRY